jgi:hypothetical protein
VDTPETKANPEASAPPKKKKPAKLGKRILRWLLLNVMPPIAHVYMSWFNYTALKDHEKLLTLVNPEGLLDRINRQRLPVILALWHNRLGFGPTAYQYVDGPGAAIMVSRSFDGELIAAVLAQFKNFKAVRGGSSKPGQAKGGQEALAEMIELSKQGVDLVITPDGPQGPKYQAKRGIIDLAKATGLPIFPVSANCSNYFVAKSWDQTRLPKPYAHFVYALGEPITVPPDADEAMIDKLRLEVERVMVELTEFVDHYFDPKPESGADKPS